MLTNCLPAHQLQLLKLWKQRIDLKSCSQGIPCSVLCSWLWDFFALVMRVSITFLQGSPGDGPGELFCCREIGKLLACNPWAGLAGCCRKQSWANDLYLERGVFSWKTLMCPWESLTIPLASWKRTSRKSFKWCTYPPSFTKQSWSIVWDSFHPDESQGPWVEKELQDKTNGL